MADENEFAELGSWTPGFGKDYYVEHQYYKSPKVKDSNIKDDKTNLVNSPYTNYDKYYTREEIMDIWAKPLESRDYVVKDTEKKILKATPETFHTLLHLSPAAPCAPHILNMQMDQCNNPKLGKSNSSMMQYSACNSHYFKLIHCVNKHRRWYEARFESLASVLPEDQVPRRTPTMDYRYKAESSEFSKGSEKK